MNALLWWGYWAVVVFIVLDVACSWNKIEAKRDGVFFAALVFVLLGWPVWLLCRFIGRRLKRRR